MDLRTLLRWIAVVALPLQLVPARVAAQVPQSFIEAGIPGCDFEAGPETALCVIAFIAHAIQLLFIMTGAFFLILIIIAGYQIAVGTAISQKEAGKERLKWAIVGFSLAALSYFIIDFVICALVGC